MKIKYWGPLFWYMIHLVAFNYPVNPTAKNKKHVILFYELIYKLLPCPICQKHYLKWLQTYPVKLFVGTRKHLALWTVRFHNNVNKRKNKEIISHPEACKLYYHPLNITEEEIKTNANKNDGLYKIKVDHQKLKQLFEFQFQRAEFNQMAWDEFTMFIGSLQSLFPCQICRSNFRRYYSQYPLEKYIQSMVGFHLWYDSFFKNQDENEHFYFNSTPDKITQLKKYKSR